MNLTTPSDVPQFTETIRCPQCDLVQQATVEVTVLWNIYLHTCEGCGYTIMESEWERVQPPLTTTQS